MPEGDTVWQAAQRLHRGLVGAPLLEVDLRWPGLSTLELTGRTTREVVARGKHLLHRLSDGVTIHSHLKMEGSWRVGPAPAGRPSAWGATDVRALVRTRNAVAVGRRLGMLDVVATSDEDTLVGHLGPDVLGPDWNLDIALTNLRRDPDVPVAVAMLDQRNLAGLGTVYVSESLFRQRISPWTPVGALPDVALSHVVERAHRLISANRDVTVRTLTGSRVAGEENNVHGRAGRPCRLCGETVRVDPIGTAPHDRVMFHCPRCQPAGASAREPLIPRSSAGAHVDMAADTDGRAAAHPDGRAVAHPDGRTAAHPDGRAADPDRRSAATGRAPGAGSSR